MITGNHKPAALACNFTGDIEWRLLACAFDYDIAKPVIRQVVDAFYRAGKRHRVRCPHLFGQTKGNGATTDGNDASASGSRQPCEQCPQETNAHDCNRVAFGNLASPENIHGAAKRFPGHWL